MEDEEDLLSAYDAFASQEDEEERLRQESLGASLLAPARKPDEAASERQIADEAGVPAPVVAAYPEITARQAEQRRIERLTQNSPFLRQWLRNPENLAIARDDVESLSWWERLPQFPEAVGMAIVLGPQHAARRVNELWTQGELDVEHGRLAYRDMRARQGHGPALTHEERSRLAELSARPGQDDYGPFIIGPTVRMAPQFFGSLQRGGRLAARRFFKTRDEFYGGGLRDARARRNIQENPVLAGALSPLAFGSSVVAAVGGFGEGYLGFGFEQEAGAAYQEMLSVGIDPAIAARRAEEYGVWSTALEFVGDSLLLPAAGVTQLAKRAFSAEARQIISRLSSRPLAVFGSRLGASAATEGAEEAAQQLAQLIHQNLAAQESAGENVDVWRAWRESLTPEALQKILYAGYIGAQAGAGFATIPSAANLYFDMREVAGADRNAALWEQGIRQAQASRLAQRHAGAFEEAVSAMDRSSVFLDADQFVAFHQSARRDPVEAARDLGVSEKALYDALRAHGQIEIPTAVFAARVLRMPQNAPLAQHARAFPEDATPAERSMAQEVFRAHVEQVAKEARTVAADNEIGAVVEERVRALLDEAHREGGTSPTINRNYARLYGAFSRAIMAIARKSGDDYAQRTDQFLRSLFLERFDVAGPTRAEGLTERTPSPPAAAQPARQDAPTLLDAARQIAAGSQTSEGAGSADLVEAYANALAARSLGQTDAQELIDSLVAGMEGAQIAEAETRAQEILAGAADEPLAAEFEQGAQGQPQDLFQAPSGEGKRGSTIFQRLEDGGLRAVTVNLFQANDLSTFLHESGHVFLEVLHAVASDPNAPTELQDMWRATQEWMGLWDYQWDEMTLEERRPYHELWARTFEAYLMEGRAPSFSLREAFAAFKAWLLQIYRDITRIGETRLSPEIRKVFDRLLATEQEMTEARAAAGVDRGVFATREESGLSEAAWAEYQRAIGEAREAQEAALRARAMEAYTRKQKRWWRDERNRVRRAVVRQVDADSARRAYEHLAFGEWRELPQEISESGEIVSATPAPGEMVEKPEGLPPMVLSAEALADEYGPGIFSELPRGLRPARSADAEALLAEAMALKKGGKVKQPQRLAAFLRAAGGLKDEGGEIAQAIGGAKMRPGLINSVSGLTLDQAASLAYQAGYFGAPPRAQQDNLYQSLLEDDWDAPLLYSQISEISDAAPGPMQPGEVREILYRGGPAPGGMVFLTPHAEVARRYGALGAYRVNGAIKDIGYVRDVGAMNAEAKIARKEGFDGIRYTANDIGRLGLQEQVLVFDASNVEPVHGREVNVRLALLNAFGRDAQRLLDMGQVEVMASAGDIARATGRPIPAGVKGVHDPRTGKSYINAENVTVREAAGIILHEVGVHAGMRNMLGPRFDDLMAAVDNLAESGDALAKAAREHVDDLVARGEMREQDAAEEAVAYLVANAPDLPFVRRLLAHVRMWLWRTFNGASWIGRLTVDDIRTLAVASLRRQARLAAREALAPSGGEIIPEGDWDAPLLYSRAKDAPPDPADPAQWRALAESHPFFRDHMAGGLPNVARAQAVLMWNARNPDGTFRFSLADIANATGYKESSIASTLTTARNAGVDVVRRAGHTRPGVLAGGERTNRIVELREKGVSIAQIAERLGTSRNNVKATLSQLRHGKRGPPELQMRVRALYSLGGDDRAPPAVEGGEIISVFRGSARATDSNFAPFSHFGTERAARERIKQTRMRGRRPRIVPIDLKLRQIVEMKESGYEHTPEMIVRALAKAGYLNHDDLAYIQEPIVAGRELARAGYAREFHGRDPIEVATERAAEVLERKGIDAIRYQNQVEDPGSYSYIVFNPQRAGPRGSFAPATDRVQAALANAFGRDAQRLLDMGQVEVVASAGDIARATGRPIPMDVKGVHDPRTGKSYINAENVTVREAAGIILHEVGVHVGLRDMLGDALWLKLDAEMDALLKSGDPLVKEMQARIDDLVERGLMRQKDAREELIAYTVENAPDLPFVRRLLAHVRMWLWRTFNGASWIGRLTVDDIRTLAVASLRRQARLAEREARSGLQPLGYQLGYQGSDTGEAIEWLRAKAKGLPMDEASRMARAKAMGFDVDTPLYHGTGAEFKEFRRSPGLDGDGVYLTLDPESASRYARNATRGAISGQSVIPVYARGARSVEGYKNIRVVSDPRNIRSRFAAFDPDYSESANLMASNPEGRELDAMGFSSISLEAAKALPSRAMRGSEAINRILKARGVEGFTGRVKDEVDFLGLREEFGARKSVTKEEILDYIRIHRLVLDEAFSRFDPKGESQTVTNSPVRRGPGDLRLPGDEPVFELRIKIPEGLPGSDFHSHWSRPPSNDMGVLVSIRGEERVDDQGQRTLFGGEVQSDLATAVRAAAHGRKREAAEFAAYTARKKHATELLERLGVNLDALPRNEGPFSLHENAGVVEAITNLVLAPNGNGITVTAEVASRAVPSMERDLQYYRERKHERYKGENIYEMRRREKALPIARKIDAGGLAAWRAVADWYWSQFSVSPPSEEQAFEHAPLASKTSAWTGAAVRALVFRAARDGFDSVSFPTGETSALIQGNRSAAAHYDTNVRGAAQKIARAFGVELREGSVGYSPRRIAGAQSSASAYVLPITPEMRARILNEGLPLFSRGWDDAAPSDKRHTGRGTARRDATGAEITPEGAPEIGSPEWAQAVAAARAKPPRERSPIERWMVKVEDEGPLYSFGGEGAKTADQDWVRQLADDLIADFNGDIDAAIRSTLHPGHKTSYVQEAVRNILVRMRPNGAEGLDLPAPLPPRRSQAELDAEFAAESQKAKQAARAAMLADERADRQFDRAPRTEVGNEFGGVRLVGGTGVDRPAVYEIEAPNGAEYRMHIQPDGTIDVDARVHLASDNAAWGRDFYRRMLAAVFFDARTVGRPRYSLRYFAGMQPDILNEVRGDFHRALLKRAEARGELPFGYRIVSDDSGGGVSLIRQTLGEEYFQGDNERPTPRELLDALIADLRNERAVYSVSDLNAAADNAERDAAIRWFESRGIDLSLNKDALRAQIIAALEREDDKNAVHPDVVAPWFGFSSGDELIQALRNLKPRQQAIEDGIDAILEAEYGDPFRDGTIAEDARKAANIEAQARVLEIELAAIEAAAGGRSTPVNRAAKRFASEAIERMSVMELRRYHKFLAAERRAARNAQAALAKGDHEGAALHKSRQIASLWMYNLARDAAEDVDKAQAYFRKFDRQAIRAKIHPPLLDQIDQALEGVALRLRPPLSDRRRARLQSWIADMTEQGFDHMIDPASLQAPGGKPFAHLSYEEVRGLRDAVRNFEHIGRRWKEALVAGDKRQFNDIVDKIVTQIERVGTITDDQIKGLSPTAMESANALRLKAHAEHVKPEFLFRLLDGLQDSGPVWREMFAPFARAEDAELEMRTASAARMASIFAVYSRKERAKLFRSKRFIPEVLLPMSKAEMLSVALNWGNEGNRQALMEGYGWSERQVEAILDKLDERDWMVVQSIFDWLEEYRAPSFDLHERLTGVRPQAVEAVPIKTRFGEIRGGYFPLRYRTDTSEKAFRREDKTRTLEEWGSNWIRPQTKKGHLIERVGSGGQKVLLDIGVLSEHVENVIHDITHREAVLHGVRLLADERIQEAFIGAVGREAFRILRPWLSRIASDIKDPTTVLEKTLLRLRMGAQVVNMGWKIATAIVQVLGYMNAVPRVGAAQMLKQAFAFLGNPVGMKPKLEFVFARSTFMRHRMGTFDRDVRDAINKLKGRADSDPLPLGVRQSMFWLVGATDMGVSVPTWLAAYENAMEGKVGSIAPGDERAAIEHADSVVRMTQGAGGAKDLSLIAGSKREIMRLFTMFYSYFSVLYNQLYTEQGPGVRAGLISPTAFVVNMMLLWFLPATLSIMLQDRFARDDDEEDLEWVLRIGKEVGLYPLASIVGVRDVVNVLGVSRYDFEISPVTEAGERTVMAANRIAKIGVKTASGDDVDDREIRAAMKDTALALGYWFGLPSRQVWITGEYAFDVATGEEPSPIDDPGRAFSEGLLRDTE